MTNHEDVVHESAPTWSDIIGSVILEAGIPEASRTAGMITLTTPDGLRVCPRFQFKPGEDGEPVVITPLADAWVLLSRYQIEILGESEWTAIARLRTKRAELIGKSWADVLIEDQSSEDDIKIVYDLIIEDFEKGYKRLED